MSDFTQSAVVGLLAGSFTSLIIISVHLARLVSEARRVSEELRRLNVRQKEVTGL